MLLCAQIGLSASHHQAPTAAHVPGLSRAGKVSFGMPVLGAEDHPPSRAAPGWAWQVGASLVVLVRVLLILSAAGGPLPAHREGGRCTSLFLRAEPLGLTRLGYLWGKGSSKKEPAQEP